MYKFIYEIEAYLNDVLTFGNDMLLFAIHSETHIDSMKLFVDDNEATIDGMLAFVDDHCFVCHLE